MKRAELGERLRKLKADRAALETARKASVARLAAWATKHLGGGYCVDWDGPEPASVVLSWDEAKRLIARLRKAERTNCAEDQISRPEHRAGQAGAD